MLASAAASGGLSLPLIGALLGHTDNATTARSAHVVNSSRKCAAEQLSAAVAAALLGLDTPEAQRRARMGRMSCLRRAHGICSRSR
jgi:hypothetical protein